ncbi:MAG: helix-turn-helix domain-containing protein [Syntrophomonadaceae bacterium]|nr:helix-turn-helix domain-containing protein [Syntrophomonadaceae bacterium]
MSKSRKSNNKRLLPFPVIAAASGGDIDAINKVLKHYEGYIIALSTRRFHDEYGNVHLFLDEELRRILETRLITKILTFRVA